MVSQGFQPEMRGVAMRDIGRHAPRLKAMGRPKTLGNRLYGSLSAKFGITAKGRVVGMDVAEIAPARDVNGIFCIAAGRLVLNLIGAPARAGTFERNATR